MKLTWPHAAAMRPGAVLTGAVVRAAHRRLRSLASLSALIVVLLAAAACQPAFVAVPAPHTGAAAADPVMPLTPPAPTFSRKELLDSRTCGGCHAEAFAQWQQSPHAAAADDAVFLAMNRMAQRETKGAIGSFCVQCHAPMALREGATTDGLNLHDVPRPLKGVTCYFCHDADSVAGNHNNPLHLAKSTTMRGPLHDAVTTTAHGSAYSPLHDRNTLSSSSLCGSCHDVVTPPGAALESTYKEWQASVYSHAVTGQSCSGCHMPQSTSKAPISDQDGSPDRYRHAHDFPGLDLPMPHVPTDGPPAVEQDRKLAESSLTALLNKTLQTALCVKQTGPNAGIRVVLDNVGAGHAFTSGAVQDRRLWMEVKAYRQGELMYESGVVPEGSPVLSHMDDDLWLMRSCMFDADGKATEHFWQAQSIDSNPLPTISTFNPSDPNFYRSNVVRAYPKNPLATLGFVPDRVTLRILVEPIGLDLLQELVAAGDLDASVLAQAKRIVVGPEAELTWTPQAATTGYQEHGMPVQCVSHSSINLTGMLFPAPDHQRCDLGVRHDSGAAKPHHALAEPPRRQSLRSRPHH